MCTLNRTLIFPLFFLFAYPFSGAQGFEGIITMTKYEADSQRVTTFTVKGDFVQVLMRTGNGPVRVINDNGKGVSTSLFTKNGKKYAYISRRADQKDRPLDDRQKMILELAKEQVAMQVTQETRKVGDYTCTKIDGQDHKEYVEAWVTKSIDLSLFDLFPQDQSPESESVDLQRMIWEKGFVMEYWIKNKESGEVSKITFDPKRQTVSDDLFTYVSEDYYVFDQHTLNSLYQQAAKDPEKMQELRELLEAFQSN